MYAAVKIKCKFAKFDLRRIGATGDNFLAAGTKASDGLETIFLWFISMGSPKRAGRRPGSLDQNPGSGIGPGSLRASMLTPQV